MTTMQGVTQLAGRLSPGQEKRLDDALAAAIQSVAEPQRRRSRNPLKFVKHRLDRRALRREIQARTSPRELLAVGGQKKASTDWRKAAVESWPERLADEFALAASLGLQEDNREAWRNALRGRAPKTWGAEVQQALEWRMADDPRLSPLLDRLDRGTEQEFRAIAASGTFAYQRAIPIALALFFAIFAALVAIAVILAVS